MPMLACPHEPLGLVLFDDGPRCVLKTNCCLAYSFFMTNMYTGKWGRGGGGGFGRDTGGGLVNWSSQGSWAIENFANVKNAFVLVKISKNERRDRKIELKRKRGRAVRKKMYCNA